MNGIIHPLGVRIWHWCNAIIVFFLILTGIELRVPSFSLFGSYRFVVTSHKYAGYIMACSFLFWLTYYIVTRSLVRQYILTGKDIGRLPKQALYYGLFYFMGRPNPFHPTAASRFNPLQKIAYSFIMFIGTPGIIVTGILFSDIVGFYPLIQALGGIRILDAVHVIFAYLFVLYLLVHLYMATLGPKVYSHVKAMITGSEDEKKKRAATS